jgi:hypothetical protein
MRQILHLLVVDASSGTALVSHYGTRWLLPVLTCAERARADPLAVRWAASRGISCDVVGQWLGRVNAQGLDWLMVLNAAGLPQKADSQLKRTALPTLESTRAVVEYQGWALARALRDGPLPSMRGPFGSFGWLDDVKEWMASILGPVSNTAISHLRSSPYEVVLRARTTRADLYFKGLTSERAVEARLTQAMAAVLPEHFARTLALDDRADRSVWWAAAACPGRSATEAHRVASQLAAVQQRVVTQPQIRQNLRMLDFDAALRWGSELLSGAACAEQLERRAHVVMTSSVPESWIPMDLDPTNVLLDGSGTVRFIDLDDSLLGPAPLAMALFAMRARGMRAVACTASRSLCETYERSWAPRLGDVDWPAFEAAATLLVAWLGWQRLERNIRFGQVYAARGLAETRIRDWLTRCVHLI